MKWEPALENEHSYYLALPISTLLEPIQMNLSFVITQRQGIIQFSVLFVMLIKKKSMGLLSIALKMALNKQRTKLFAPLRIYYKLPDTTAYEH